jgi:hypothetical protein
LQAPGAGSSSFIVSRAPHETRIADAKLLGAYDIVASGKEKDLHFFQIDPTRVSFSLDSCCATMLTSSGKENGQISLLKLTHNNFWYIFLSSNPSY